MQCTLCHTPLSINEGLPEYYYRCQTCDAIVLDNVKYLSPEDEKSRYLLHNNDVHDPGYQKFAAPAIEYILQHCRPDQKGLDYGCGPDSVIAWTLSNHHFQVSLYDPFFAPDREVLKDTYAYVICTEVAEHFHNPSSEFANLHHLLDPGGFLLLMTLLYDDHIDFANWHYKRDPAHVFFYTLKTIEYICQQFGFDLESADGRLIVFRKPVQAFIL